ncbi:hypothetical protein ACFQ41_01160 [Lacticaseibacillus suilingensis]|uniref:Uncharacterized protein n=1 Tax=Lacticaseibacillus suilingensis TaxID=2799577 RepID=A0ABW4BFQ4_9LACO|nr:hypothetical protein [Lacticaseibacillus suilingensis]
MRIIKGEMIGLKTVLLRSLVALRKANAGVISYASWPATEKRWQTI